MNADGDGVVRDERAEVRQAEQLRSLTLPQFKTVPTAARRTGLRLESAFWTALDWLSRTSGAKRSLYVARIAEHAQASGINVSSAIRAVTAARLLEENERMRPLVQPGAMVRLLQASPTPSFALDRQKRLVQVNPEFVRYLRAVAGTLAGDVHVDRAELTLDRTIDKVIADLAAASAVECGVTIRLQNRELRASARIVLVPPSPSSLIVGYMLR